jgi:hypothetical protein
MPTTGGALPPPLSHNDKVGRGEKIKKLTFNPAMFDIHFTGAPLNCLQKRCDILDKMFDFRWNMDYQATGKYKYVLDVSFGTPPLPPLRLIFERLWTYRWTGMGGPHGLNG